MSSTVGRAKSQSQVLASHFIGLNWRNGQEYPKPDGIDLDHWRWEFLRRSQEYQQDWIDVNRKGPTDTRTWKKKSWHKTLKALLDKYGLQIVLPDPALQFPPSLQFRHPAEKVHVGSIDKLGRFTSIRLPPGRAAVLFDIMKPLGPQLTLAKSSLEHAQVLLTGRKHGRRKHFTHWALLLRILDARSQGVTYSKIGQVLLDIADYNDAAARAKQLHTEALKLSRNFPF